MKTSVLTMVASALTAAACYGEGDFEPVLAVGREMGTTAIGGRVVQVIDEGSMLVSIKRIDYDSLSVLVLVKCSTKGLADDVKIGPDD